MLPVLFPSGPSDFRPILTGPRSAAVPNCVDINRVSVVLVRDCARETINMHATITSHRDHIAALCERLGVRRLDVFGSATTAAFDEVASDVDFLVEFEDPTSPSYFDDFFSLKEGLEQILGRPADLVTRASIQNPYFLRRVEETRESLYEA